MILSYGLNSSIQYGFWLWAFLIKVMKFSFEPSGRHQKIDRDKKYFPFWEVYYISAKCRYKRLCGFRNKPHRKQREKWLSHYSFAFLSSISKHKDHIICSCSHRKWLLNFERGVVMFVTAQTIWSCHCYVNLETLYVCLDRTCKWICVDAVYYVRECLRASCLMTKRFIKWGVK
jgi:hypothetical protein